MKPAVPPPDDRKGLPGYVRRDWEVVDYDCFQLAGTGLWFRGPAPARLTPGQYFSAIGAAQTFGCFCSEPYPSLLEQRLGRPALNLGYSGAGPEFFLRQPAVLDQINRGAFCIVQVMSARSTSNSWFTNPEGLAHGWSRGNEPTTAEAVFDDAIRADLARLPLPSRLTVGLIKRLGLPLPTVRRLVNESRKRWAQDCLALLDAITVPKIVLWFSERAPDYAPRYHRRSAVLGKFPHLVDRTTLARVVAAADRYVECVSTRGMPQPLVSRFTGEPVAVDLEADKKPLADGSGQSASLYKGVWWTNGYYPSPEMHQDAAAALEPACREAMGEPPASAS